MTPEEIQELASAIRTLRETINFWKSKNPNPTPAADGILQGLRDLHAAKVQEIGPYTDEWFPVDNDQF